MTGQCKMIEKILACNIHSPPKSMRRAMKVDRRVSWKKYIYSPLLLQHKSKLTFLSKCYFIIIHLSRDWLPYIFSIFSRVSSTILHGFIFPKFWGYKALPPSFIFLWKLICQYMYVYLQQLLLLSFILIYIFLRGHCSINPCFWEGVDVACQSFLLSSCIALSFHTTRKNYATLIHSFGRGLILYIYTFFSFKNLSYHPSLLCQSMLLGGGGCRMPNFSFIILHWSFHTTREELFNHSTLIHSFGRGLILYIYIHLFIYLSRISSIILNCSIDPCFWEGVDVACQSVLLSSCIALSPILIEQTLYPYWLLWEGIAFYIYIICVHTFLSRISSIILHCSLNPCFWGGACSMPNFSFIIRHCSVMPYC